jgi:hypothetical protein
MDVRSFVEADLKRAAQRVLDKAKELCTQVCTGNLDPSLLLRSICRCSRTECIMNAVSLD